MVQKKDSDRDRQKQGQGKGNREQKARRGQGLGGVGTNLRDREGGGGQQNPRAVEGPQKSGPLPPQLPQCQAGLWNPQSLS